MFIRTLIILSLLLVSNTAFSQRQVCGAIIDRDNNKESITGAKIQEEGTDNYVFSDIEGKFEIITLKDTCILIISMLGFESESLKITNNTEKNISLAYYSHTLKWITAGADYDFINSKSGIQFSNGYDERPLIHFEDFSDKYIYKVSFKTGFNKEYSFGGAIGWLYPTRFINMITLEYEQFHYSEKEIFKYKNINITGAKYLEPIDSEIILKLGFQSLNKKDNFGINLAIQKVLFQNRLYSELSAGYYFDYWIYSIYAQGFIYKDRVGLKLSYDRIDNFDLLTLGVNFLFSISK
ncbi:hypothetical protein M2451_001115 [Dysgonomonas sp. PFB1-18]|uniref:carboxypeptidase-like regulatory domain-containing protein n=1 Tax=unclassified Dysgonomonas TaxID=2630389 RepID=UPI002476CB21|nr:MULTISPECIES: carboxypeptidase-like regulatory domain-containing protein [unclassified Dysgonomonas]MDH6308260.1 hypothetical protein [Dysgonomonas sp. PF1-14]MDH6338301.1 hypothetical protein [Dysgonomonas sp. PF1-16]MDH6379798.1 hypothetical protein [Dysgonomonas sp. PFB1-18]MDH6397112.1 hypothetical protein [Dysgonomonas sp. PF1-23]